MGTRLALRIQERYEGLTASEQKLATLLLDRPDEILTFSATELAGLAGVSKATAARFFRNLGYSDFNECACRPARSATAPARCTRCPMPAEPPEGASTVPTHLQVEMANLTRTFEDLRSDLLGSVADRLAAAERVWVAGLGAEGRPRPPRPHPDGADPPRRSSRLGEHRHLGGGARLDRPRRRAPRDRAPAVALGDRSDPRFRPHDPSRHHRRHRPHQRRPHAPPRRHRAGLPHIEPGPGDLAHHGALDAPPPHQRARRPPRPSALRRRDLIADLREELDPQD